MPHTCCVSQCFNRFGKNKEKSFYRIPKVSVMKGSNMEALTLKRRNLWIKNLSLKSEDSLSINARVCSDHFVKGCPSSVMAVNDVDWAPTLKLGHSNNSDFLDSEIVIAYVSHDRTGGANDSKSLLRMILTGQDVTSIKEPEYTTCEENDNDDEQDEVFADHVKPMELFINSNMSRENELLKGSWVSEKPNKCDRCGKSFVYVDDLQVHMETHTWKNTLKCNICDSLFPSEGLLDEHSLSHDSDHLYKCFICNCRFKCSHSMKSHLATHANEKNVRCNMCGVLLSECEHLRYFTNILDNDKPCQSDEIDTSEFLSDQMSQYLPVVYLRGAKDKEITASGDPEKNIIIHPERQYLCVNCGQKFSQLKLLEIHMLIHTYDGNDAICSDSDIKHGGLHRCDICGKNFQWSDNLKEHKKFHSINHDNPYKELVKRLTTDKEHVPTSLANHKEHVPTSLANHKEHVPTSLANHKEHVPTSLANHKADKSFKCEFCGETYTILDKFITHLKIHEGNLKPVTERSMMRKVKQKYFTKEHNLGVKLFKCDICSNSFVWVENLIAHVKIHEDHKSNHYYEDLLKKHRDVSENDSAYVHTCDICDCRFKDPGSLQAHNIIHRYEKPYSCNICAKKSLRIEYFKKHMTVHTGKVPFRCRICGKGYTNVNDRVRCVAIHKSERLYMCEICGKGLSTSTSLKQHMAVHSDNRSYKCHICDKEFSRSAYLLQRHMAVHRHQLQFSVSRPPS